MYNDYNNSPKYISKIYSFKEIIFGVFYVLTSTNKKNDKLQQYTTYCWPGNTLDVVIYAASQYLHVFYIFLCIISVNSDKSNDTFPNRSHYFTIDCMGQHKQNG